MFTYSLDEQGDFENATKVKRPVFIGGVIYDDTDDEDDLKTEYRRIEAYYRMTIADASDGSEGFIFPNALHSDGNRERNSNIVAPVKEQIRKTLGEFLQQGTYNGERLCDSQGRAFPCRKGSYRIFLILKSDEGMSRLLSDNANIFAKDDYASNLYFHMADEAVTRLIFNNPLADCITDISLDIATRSTGNMTDSDPIAAEYKRLGYKKIFIDERNTRGPFRYSLTNPDIYRTLIAEEIIDAGKPNIKVTDFKVRSIRYSHYSCDDRMEFLYMADTVCSYLGFKLDGTQADHWLRQIKAKAQELMGSNGSLIFGYDEIDAIYSNAWMKYKNGDYYSALAISYEASQKKGAFAELYNEYWFSNIGGKITSKANASELAAAIRKLDESRYRNDYDQSKGIYIFNILKDAVNKVKNPSPDFLKIQYMFYDCGVSMYCHLGASEKAEQYYNLCIEHADTADIEQFLSTMNRMTVFCCDYLDMKKALRIADENVRCQERISELKVKMAVPRKSGYGYIPLGKTLSQRGQVYAFLRDARAEDDFRNALVNFDEGSPDYKITQSYLLHFYLDSRNMEAYEAEAKKYFDGASELTQQLKYLLIEGAKRDSLINMKFALYVFVRSLYIFYRDSVTDNLWNSLKNAETSFGKKIKKKDFLITDHPAEIIFKYMWLLAVSRGDEEAAGFYEDRLNKCLITKGPTVSAIRKYGKIQCIMARGDASSAKKCISSLYDFFKDNFYTMENLELPESVDEALHQLDGIMSFMYQ